MFFLTSSPSTLTLSFPVSLILSVCLLLFSAPYKEPPYPVLELPPNCSF